MSRSESDLRDLFAAADAPAAPIDTARVIARARRRRLPRQIGAGALGAFAIASIAVIGVPLLQTGSGPAVTTMESAPDSGGASDSLLVEIKRAPADRLNLCTSPVAEFVPSASGLVLDVEFPATAPVGTAPIQGVVHLTNTSAETVSGSTASSPAVALSQNGIVLWHSNGPVDLSATRVDLAPGESLEYSAFFVPVSCGVEDDSAEAFRSDLPAVPAGLYEISAAIDFVPDAAPADGTGSGLDLVTSERATIELQ